MTRLSLTSAFVQRAIGHALEHGFRDEVLAGWPVHSLTLPIVHCTHNI